MQLMHGLNREDKAADWHLASCRLLTFFGPVKAVHAQLGTE